MKRLPAYLFITAIILLSLTGCEKDGESAQSGDGIDVLTAITAQYRKISPQLAKEMMEGQEVLILDVRTEQEYDAGHIRGAILIPNETITTDARPEELKDTEQTILVYCRSGNRSSQAARKLVSLGYVNVYDFGGINTWPYELVQ